MQIRGSSRPSTQSVLKGSPWMQGHCDWVFPILLVVKKSHSQPPGMVRKKPDVNNGINYQPQPVGRVSEPSTGWLHHFHCHLLKFLDVALHHHPKHIIWGAFTSLTEHIPSYWMMSSSHHIIFAIFLKQTVFCVFFHCDHFLIPQLKQWHGPFIDPKVARENGQFPGTLVLWSTKKICPGSIPSKMVVFFCYFFKTGMLVWLEFMFFSISMWTKYIPPYNPCMAYLPTFTIKNQQNVRKYTSPMDPIWVPDVFPLRLHHQSAR